jgi:hypothetical protein
VLSRVQLCTLMARACSRSLWSVKRLQLSGYSMHFFAIPWSHLLHLPSLLIAPESHTFCPAMSCPVSHPWEPYLLSYYDLYCPVAQPYESVLSCLTLWSLLLGKLSKQLWMRRRTAFCVSIFPIHSGAIPSILIYQNQRWEEYSVCIRSFYNFRP